MIYYHRPHTVPAIAGIPAFSPPRSISRFAQIRGENLGGGGCIVSSRSIEMTAASVDSL